MRMYVCMCVCVRVYVCIYMPQSEPGAGRGYICYGKRGSIFRMYARVCMGVMYMAGSPLPSSIYHPPRTRDTGRKPKKKKKIKQSANQCALLVHVFLLAGGGGTMQSSRPLYFLVFHPAAFLRQAIVVYAIASIHPPILSDGYAFVVNFFLLPCISSTHTHSLSLARARIQGRSRNHSRTAL